ncbi:MAG: hypothetical protein ACRYGA_04710 [Janthinobacterium lividum]
MGIALLTFVDLLAPLQSLACRWMPKRSAATADRSAGLRYVAVRPACTIRDAASEIVGNARTATVATVTPSKAAARPLRVVRTVDSQCAGRRTGQVVLSGRLVDVCAELDRLAALEAAEISHVPMGTRVLH